jgi:hypothetical protein
MLVLGCGGVDELMAMIRGVVETGMTPPGNRNFDRQRLLVQTFALITKEEKLNFNWGFPNTLAEV